jgi:DNA invertase Pin-like site-specific DNA recombinase
MARAIKLIRLSRYRTEDPTVSPDVQDKLCDKWINEHSHTLVGRGADLDVSAFKISPFARPEAGNWLTYRKNEFDIVVWARLDRAIRNMADMSDLVRWAKENKKTLVFVKGPSGNPLILDMSIDTMGEFLAMVFAFAAQAEAQADSERVTEARSFMRHAGRYAGGWTPFGYKPAERKQGKGFELVQDEYAPILRRMVDDTLKGMGPTAIADWLNAEGIPTSKDILRIRRKKIEPQGLQWRYPAVLGILRSKAMCGITELDGKVIYGDDGKSVRFGEPIVNDAEWERVQKALDKLSKPQNRQRKDSPWLTGVTFCLSCGGPLYSKRQTNRHGKVYEYMTCWNVRQGKCHARQIRQDRLEALIDERVIERGNGHPYMEPRTIGGRNHAAEMATVRAAIKDLAGEAALAEAMGESAADQKAKLDILKNRLHILRDMPDEPDRIILVQTGETIAQHWASLNGQGKAAMLQSHQAKVSAEQTANGLVVELDAGTLTPTLPEPTVQAS